MGERARALDRGSASAETLSAWYGLSLRLSPGRDAAGRLANVYRSAGQAEQAVLLWRWLADRFPLEEGDYWWAIAQAAELESAWDQAAQAYARGAQVASEPYDFWMRQAALFGRLERVREQEQAYHRAIEACPDCVAPYLALGHLWRRQGQLQGARAWFGEAARVAPRSVYPLYYQAQVLYDEGARSAAVQSLERALVLHQGQRWEWAMQLGDWRRQGGDRSGALAAYRQALEWKPDETAIQERIRDLQLGVGESENH
jgi:tetratricopeptide (TPR) repeat protein